MLKSLIDRFLGPRPTKVNCWCCGQDSYLLPGSGQTPRDWYCYLCENKNLRDENGEILDIQPSHNQPTTTQGYCVRTRLSDSSQQLCEDCLSNERRIRAILDEYIPDESDPRYVERCNNAAEQEKYLQEKYPLCKVCQLKVDRFNAAQETRLPKKVESKSRVDEADKKTSWLFRILNSSQLLDMVYFISECIWIGGHISSLLFTFYGYCYPPRRSQLMITIPPENFYNTLRTLIMGDGGRQLMLKSITTDFFSNLLDSLGCLVPFQSKEKDCRMTMDYIAFYYCINVLSVFVTYWHPLVSRQFEGGDPKAKNYDIYKACQIILLIYRMLIPIFLQSIAPDLLLGLLVAYIGSLYFTVFRVQVQGYRVLKRVGKNLNVGSNNDTVTPTTSRPRPYYSNDDLRDAMTYQRKNHINYQDIAVERDDDVHRTTYDFNRMHL